ncbi:MAG: TlpA family protein disulfide reductase [Agathobacter rectalis]
MKGVTNYDNKKTFISIFTLCIALLFTACGTQDSAGTANTKDSVTKSGTEASDNSNARLNDLYQQENQLFAKHEAIWNKASFTEAELKTLTEDIDAIRKIEEQIAEIENKTTSDSSKKNNTEATSPFSNLSGKDFNGNPVDESLFSKNAVTVVNFWFNGCKPCVAELSKLNELNEAIRSMGGEVVGINTETFNGNKTAIKEASAILESQGAKYRNLSIDSSSNAGKYASDIMAFPTTILVDRNGNIVGDPMLGGIDNKDNYDTLMKQIKSVIAADSNSK